MIGFKRSDYNFVEADLQLIDDVKGRGVIYRGKQIIPVNTIICLFPGEEIVRFPKEKNLNLNKWRNRCANDTKKLDRLESDLPLSDYASRLAVIDFDENEIAIGYHYRFIEPMCKNEQFEELVQIHKSNRDPNILTAIKELKLPKNYPHMGAFINEPYRKEKPNAMLVEPHEWISGLRESKKNQVESEYLIKTSNSTYTRETINYLQRHAIVSTRPIENGDEILMKYSRKNTVPPPTRPSDGKDGTKCNRGKKPVRARLLYSKGEWAYFPSVAAAAAHYNCCRSHISEVCKKTGGRAGQARAHAGGFYFMFVEDHSNSVVHNSDTASSSIDAGDAVHPAILLTAAASNGPGTSSSSPEPFEGRRRCSNAGNAAEFSGKSKQPRPTVDLESDSSDSFM